MEAHDGGGEVHGWQFMMEKGRFMLEEGRFMLEEGRFML